MDFRDLSAFKRRSFDLWVAGLHAQHPERAFRRFGEPREEPTGAIAVPFRDENTGDRFEALVWPDGRVNGMRELA